MENSKEEEKQSEKESIRLTHSYSSERNVDQDRHSLAHPIQDRDEIEIQDDDKTEKIFTLTRENLMKMVEGLERVEKAKSILSEKARLYDLLKEKNESQILQIINDSKLRSLFFCFHALIDMLRINRYQKNHIWLVDFLEKLVETYKFPLVFMLNTTNGVDALKKAYKVSKGQTQKVLFQCLKIVPNTLLIHNLEFLDSTFKQIEQEENKENPDNTLVRNFTQKIADYQGYSDHDNIFALHYLKYTVFKHYDFNQKNNMSEVKEFLDLEKGFNAVEYSKDVKSVLDRERTEALKGFSEYQSNLPNQMEESYKNYKVLEKEEKSISSSTKSESVSPSPKPESIVLDGKEIPCEDVFTGDEILKNPAEKCLIKQTERDLEALEISRLINFYKTSFNSNIVKTTGKSNELKRIMESWLNLKMIEDYEKHDKRVILAHFFQLLPRCKDGTLDMRFNVNKNFVKEFITYINFGDLKGMK